MKKNCLYINLLLLVFITNSYSQIGISKPILGFSQPCPSPGFNTFNLTFSFSPVANLNASNVFNVELSNDTGQFTNPTILTTSTATTSPVSVSFSFPTNVAGLNYKIRIRSTSPASISLLSDAFPAFYAIFTSPFTINNNISNQSFCENVPYVLSIDSSGNSPLQYPQLKYRWYFNGNILAGQTLPTLNVTQAGNYYAEVDYGPCNNFAYSNFVSMSAIEVPDLVIVSETGSTQFCDNEWLTLQTSNISPTNIYKWYHNNTLINGANNAIYTATQAGTYRLEIETPGCDLVSNSLTLTVIDTSGFTTDSESDIEINAGEAITITASGADSYEWFVNGAVVPSSNSYTTNQSETIQLTGTIGACSVIKNFTVTVKPESVAGTIPNTITPNNDEVNDEWILPEQYVNKDNVEIVIFTASNEEVYRTKNYLNDWPKQEMVQNNMVYYYKILKNNSIVTKGTLSIIKK